MEDTWADQRLRIGSCEFKVLSKLVPRCEAVTRDPDSGLVEGNALKAIASYRGKDSKGKPVFGVYLTVIQAGTVALGDSVHVLQD